MRKPNIAILGATGVVGREITKITEEPAFRDRAKMSEVILNQRKNVLREDESSQPFTREDLQKGAPGAEDGYWEVPRLIE